jgi:hypothetical protein
VGRVGQVAWNKGLTKETSEHCKMHSERMKNDNPMKNKETKQKSSLAHKGKKDSLATKAKKNKKDIYLVDKI